MGNRNKGKVHTVVLVPLMLARVEGEPYLIGQSKEKKEGGKKEKRRRGKKRKKKKSQNCKRRQK